MGRKKKSRRRVQRPYGQSQCCIACGGGLCFALASMVFEEREEWKPFLDEVNRPRSAKSAIVRPEDVEEMFFHKTPWLWTVFYRAILDRPYVEHLRVSGITQNQPNDSDDPAPRDPQEARIGSAWKSPSKDFAQFQPINMLNPEDGNDRNRQIGYIVHAVCWVLLDRAIGHELVEANLRMFVNAVKQFWKENGEIWNELPPENEDPFYARLTRLVEEEQGKEHVESKPVDIFQNPLIVPEIRSLVDQAVRGHHDDGACSRQPQQTAAFDVPLEIAVMIVNTIYDDINFNQVSIDDIRKMLTAFRWKLPDSYWQSRCRKDLIFEYEDLFRSDNQSVDWQLICLGTEELFLQDGWYDKGGLRNRHRILQLLQSIKTAFLEKLEQPECS